MTPLRGSGGQILTWESDHLTTTPDRTRTPTPRAEPKVSRDDQRRQQSASGTDDEFCHVLVAGAPFRYTLCGQRLKPPLPRGHKLGKCPNGIPVCPDCQRVRGEE
jgi:hypothetical protein